MATEHTSVGVRREVKLLVHISGEVLVVSWSDLHGRTLPGRKSATSASNGAFPDAREREVYQKSASHSVGGFLTDLSWRVARFKTQQARRPKQAHLCRRSSLLRRSVHRRLAVVLAPAPLVTSWPR